MQIQTVMEIKKLRKKKDSSKGGEGSLHSSPIPPSTEGELHAMKQDPESNEGSGTSSPLATPLPPSSIGDPTDIDYDPFSSSQSEENESSIDLEEDPPTVDLLSIRSKRETEIDSYSIEPNFTPETVETETLDRLGEEQKQLQEVFLKDVLPLVKNFVERGKKRDKVFKLFSNMLEDLYPYVFGYISIRVDDFKGQQLVTKLLYEKVHTSQQSSYKHILLQILEEFPRWGEKIKHCYQYAPGVNEISGSRAATLGRDEGHERVISLNLAIHHPVHPTEANVERMCQSAPIICQNMLNFEKSFFESSTTI